LSIRIIPKLEIKGPNLVKGIHMEGLRVLGKPEDFARYYYRNGADELIYMDAVASLYGRNSLNSIIELTSQEMFIPLTVGGGLRNVEDIRKVLRAGADKVALNTAVLKRPELIREASRVFGSSTIVVSIEAKMLGNGKYEAYANFGRESTGIDALEWAKRAVDLGAGELLMTSIDRDGTRQGYDIELTSKASESVSVPVIACGGAGNLSHINDVITKGRADAVSLATILHYSLAANQHYSDTSFSQEGNVEFLQGRLSGASSKSDDLTIVKVKTFLKGQGIDCRCECEC
jgi:cyclase